MDQEKGKSLPSEYWLSTNFTVLTVMFKSKRVNSYRSKVAAKLSSLKRPKSTLQVCY